MKTIYTKFKCYPTFLRHFSRFIILNTKIVTLQYAQLPYSNRKTTVPLTALHPFLSGLLPVAFVSSCNGDVRSKIKDQTD